MIKAVIFDIDNTMYSFDKANKAAMAALGAYAKEQFGMEFEETERLVKKCMDIVTERTGENCAALHNRLLRFQCFLEEIGCADYRKALEMYHVYWDTILEVMEPEPGLISLMKRLKDKGIRIGIGSDMTAYIQYKKLEKLGALSYLDFLVTSEEAGAEKPTPRFFELCLKKAGCAPGECVFIGDSLKKDVAGPSALGMVGTHYHPAYDRDEVVYQGEVYPVITSFEEYLSGEGQEEE
ncbi:MAG: HAD family hydrolase [Lachnospiraceae bacterium]|jgi:putative hydrolase of the HAD superfamily|nr:HAD family hydrolase [Lachnospiraceae bacterium]